MKVLWPWQTWLGLGLFNFAKVSEKSIKVRQLPFSQYGSFHSKDVCLYPKF